MTGAESPGNLPQYRIEALPPSYNSLGLVLDLLSRHAPFLEWPLARLAKTIRKQLRLSQQLAALSPGNDLLGYAGWVPALRASAELWVEGRGPLQVVDGGGDARAVAIFVSTHPSVTRALIRHGRALNPEARWYFKRTYGGQMRASRRETVLDRRRTPADPNDT